jgi:D-tyrosyl-tRNA(Tyr) deacylase
MKLVVQRVSSASVSVNDQLVGSIGHGLMVLLGITHEDTREKADALIKKLVGLRIFNDEQGKMNRSILEVQGSLLVVSQFTLYANAKKGNRPSYIDAAPPEIAIPLYDYFIENLRVASELPVETGIFGAMMDVSLVNAGPVTLILEG